MGVLYACSMLAFCVVTRLSQAQVEQDVDGQYIDSDLFDADTQQADIFADGSAVQDGDLDIGGSSQIGNEDDEGLPRVREVFPGLNMSRLVSMSKRLSPRDYESRRAWYTTVMHINMSSIIPPGYGNVRKALVWTLRSGLPRNSNTISLAFCTVSVTSQELVQYHENLLEHFQNAIIPKIQKIAREQQMPNPIGDNVDLDFAEWQAQMHEEQTAGEASEDDSGMLVPRFASMPGGRARKQLPRLFARALQLYLAQINMHAPDDVAADWEPQLRPVCERLHSGSINPVVLEQRALAPAGLGLTFLASTGGAVPGAKVLPRVSIADPRGQLPPFGQTMRLRLGEGSLFAFPAFMTQQITGLLAREEAPAWACRVVVPESAISEGASGKELAGLVTTVRAFSKGRRGAARASE